MNNQSKYWTRLEEYDRSVGTGHLDWRDFYPTFIGSILFKDLEPLENFTYSERKWLHDNLKKHYITNNYIDDDGTIEKSDNSSVDFETPSIKISVNVEKTGFRPQPGRRGIKWTHWTVFKHKDDWFYFTRLDDNELYKCDGFLGLKKLLEHLDLLK